MKWIDENKDKVHTLSTQDATKFEEIVRKREAKLKKFFEDQKLLDLLKGDGFEDPLF